MKLFIIEEGKKKALFAGNLREIVRYLQENEEVYNWILDEDKNAEMPDLSSVETTRELEYELKKIDLGWWALKID
jgi:hypothetical protein